MVDLGEPFLFDIFKRGWGSDTKADQEDVRLRVGQRTESVVILLTYLKKNGIGARGFRTHFPGRTGGIKQAQRVGILTNHDSDRIIVKDLDERSFTIFSAGG
jgi:hypothetical protein